MPKLKGDKVLLRPWRRDDEKHIMTWVNDAETTRCLTHIFWTPYTEQNAETYMAMMLQGSDHTASFVMADPETEEYWGQIALENIDWRYCSAVVGIVLARKEKRGRGVGQEALMLLCRYAFETLMLNRVSLEVFADNAAARACYGKTGFVEEGVARQAVVLDGHFADLVMMGMLRSDWEKRQGERADV